MNYSGSFAAMFGLDETNKNWKGWTNNLKEDQQGCPMYSFP